MYGELPVLLRSQLRDLPDGVELSLTGELSILTAPALGCLLADLADGGAQHLVIDLRQARVLIDLEPLRRPNREFRV